MAKRHFIFMLLIVFLLSVAGICGPVEAKEDWDAIYKAAKAEKKVVVYSLSSRIFKAVKSFKKKYPGIEIEASDMRGNDQIEKLTREQAAGLYNVDVMFLANGPTLVNELLPKGMIKNYVPETLLGGQASKDVIPEKFRRPLLVHSIESKVVFYNFEAYSKAPIDSLWDLTRPEWLGKVQMKDPMLTEENMNFIMTIVQHADLMAKTYQQEFGKPIKLSSGSKNAGYEFIRRLVKNKLVLTSSDGSAAKAVGAPGQTKPPLTLSVSSSKLRYNKKGMKLAIAWNVSPKVGISKTNYVIMANKAPHPNAAKLFIRWLLGDIKGGKGMKPWFVQGQWASRADVKAPIDITLSDLDRYTWFIDYKFVYEKGLEVRDFWMGL